MRPPQTPAMHVEQGEAMPRPYEETPTHSPHPRHGPAMLTLMPQWRRWIRVWLWRRWFCLSVIFVSLATGAAVWAAASWIVSLGPAPVGEGLGFSTLLVDRGGNLLRPSTTP